MKIPPGWDYLKKAALNKLRAQRGFSSFVSLKIVKLNLHRGLLLLGRLIILLMI